MPKEGITAEESIKKVSEELNKYGYRCEIKEETDGFFATCFPSVQTYDKDKINRIEVLIPKGERLVNISVVTKEPLYIGRIGEWLRPRAFGSRRGPLYGESKYYEIEIDATNAYSLAPSLATNIVKVRRNEPLL
jgi:hypothetical protein